MNFTGAIFDLDGTLVDSLADIGGAMNHALASFGMPEHPLAAYRQLVGEGVHNLTRRALPPERGDLQGALLAEYQRYYAENLLARTCPFPGIEPLLDGLIARGIGLGILSNKPDPATRRIAEVLFARWPFRAIFGERADVPRKPDPTAALEIARILGAPPPEILFIGDSAVDMRTAVGAGMFPLGVLWGLRDREELIGAGARALVGTPDEILALAAHR